MRKLILGVVAMAGILASQPCAAQITAQAVRDSISRGVSYLRRQQKPNGNWSPYRNQPGGVTAICTLALINSGVPKEDPAIQKGIFYLRNLGNPDSTYATALQTMVFCAADPDTDRLLIRRNVEWLEKTQRKNGGWTYGDRDTEAADESNSQFAILALNEADRVGVTVSRETWRAADEYWRRRQKKDGSWGYVSTPGSGSMTCAGLASMIITSRQLSEGDAKVIAGNVHCCNKIDNNPRIQRGSKWMAKNFSVARNPGSSQGGTGRWPLYYLYALERVGRMSGQRFIGDHDWYREGAELLVQRQDLLDGSWTGTLGRQDVSTAMALLFLSKGRRPVVVSKLQHSKDQQWNRHRNDIANLVRYVEPRWKRELNWQYVNAKAATAADLLQSPVLFLSGKDGLSLSKNAKAALRDYVNQGGFLFAEACCNDQAFDRDFRQLMKELFPDSALRPLPPDHPIWFAEQRIDPNHIRPLWGLDSCCRTSVVYCPQNLGCYWELYRGIGVSYPMDVQKEIDSVLGIGANVLAYATGRQLRDKLDVPTLAKDSDLMAFQRGSLQIAKLQHNGGSDDAPSALVNLLRMTKQQLEIPVVLQRKLVDATSPQLPDFPLLFAHGRRDFTFTEAQRVALRRYLDNGGLLFGDAICASPEFVKAFRREVAALYPGKQLQRLPANHPLYSKQFRGYDIDMVKVRRADESAPDEPMAARLQVIPPLLEVLEHDQRIVVIFSPYDLSCALENHSAMDCTGYVREDAYRLGINTILFGLQQ